MYNGNLETIPGYIWWKEKVEEDCLTDNGLPYFINFSWQSPAELQVRATACQKAPKNYNKKDRWDSGKPRRLHKPFLWHIDYRGNKILANICITYMSPTTQNLSEVDFDLSRSLKVKCHGVIGLAIYGFLWMANGNIGPNLAPLRDIRFLKCGWPWLWHEIWVTLTLTFQCHSRSSVMVSLDSPYMVSYGWLMVT